MRKLGLSSLKLDEVNRVTLPLSPFEAITARASGWYDGKSVVDSDTQTIANSAGGLAATRGTTTSAESTDPAFFTHPVNNLWFPGETGNQVTTPRPYPSTHVTITYLDDTTDTETQTSDPVAVGGTAHSGQVKKIVLRENSGGGAVGATADLALDVDTSSDVDAGQETFVSATSAETWTISRSSSGLKTVSATRAGWVTDGVDDLLKLNAADAPTFTADTGKYSVALLTRIRNTQTVWMFSSESASNNGLIVWLNGSSVLIRVGGTSTLAGPSLASAFVESDLVMFVAVIDNGDAKIYSSLAGMSAGADITGVGTITHATPVAGGQASARALVPHAEYYSVLTFPDEALTESECDILADTLITGNYTP